MVSDVDSWPRARPLARALLVVAFAGCLENTFTCRKPQQTPLVFQQIELAEGDQLAQLGTHPHHALLRAFAAQEDWLQIWPGHGAGSSCGKGISAIPSSTLGYEKRFNPALAYEEERAFVAYLLAAPAG